MKLLIVGAGGQLGRELVRQGQAYRIDLLAPARNQMDITNISQVKNTLAEYCPSIVINAAGYTHVDRAEDEPELACGINKIGTANLAQCCARQKIPLLQISTDYVFDGQKGAPYLEEDPVSPLGVYGQSKADGEKTIRLILKEHIIVRTSWLYGVYGHNFVKTMLKLAKEKNIINVVADQFGSPTSATDLAEALLQIARRIKKAPTSYWGTYHYSGQGITTWHGFAEKILELAKSYESILTTRVEPIKTEAYPARARRPVFSALDCSRIKNSFKINPKPWQESLKMIIERIFSESHGNEK